ncbi:hypothetical protein AVEN_265449-1 [Araneus ventricosus]|uniref:Uncharacterized protein n=1 Tax=Araneus ventricosus TaxID=182803 RepID=A0A4Y2CHP0_ARAVE|nr:hypothetical protein AVEN_265449-1 [Araneus ventricosus]
MESRFPAMLVLWLGGEFYRGKYGMTAAARPVPQTLATILATLVTKCGTSKMLEFSISLLGRFHVTSHPSGELTLRLPEAIRSVLLIVMEHVDGAE